MSNEIIHDVLIIGAGPCGLAVASRLCEPLPSALFTENEHQRFHFMKASSPKKSKFAATSRRAKTAPDRFLSGPSISDKRLDIKVLDAHGNEWMSSWNDKFDSLKIRHLRSPMFFHPDPRDRDGLLAYTYMNEREDELKEIQGVVGKELSKHARKKKRKNGHRAQETFIDERDRQDYFRPSQALFRDFCLDLAARYDLSDAVERSSVASVSYDSPTGLFTISSLTGVRKARVVVLAVGSASKPSLPSDCPFCTLDTRGSVSHVFAPNSSSIIPANLLHQARSGLPTTIAIVGGGLTSAQIAQLATIHGITKIHLILRGPLKTKHFDVDLCWLAKFKNESMSAFWKADTDEERSEMMKHARGGGSVNPEYKNILMALVKEGKVEILEHTIVGDGKWDERHEKWALGLHQKNEERIEISVDHIVYATGVTTDFRSVSVVQPLLESHPIDIVGGMPCVTKDLMWNEEVPFFVTGRMGGLRLGPAAPNLEGARLGAEFIAAKISTLVLDWSGLDDTAIGGDGEDGLDMGRLGLGRENQFALLDSDEDSEVRSRL